jgi:hypothetical protein
VGHFHFHVHDPQVFCTTEVSADNAAFMAHGRNEVHAATPPIFAELIVRSAFMIGEPLMAKGLER